MTLSLSLTIDQVKREIEKKHPTRPKPSKQKIFFAGKFLQSQTDTLRDIMAGVRALLRLIKICRETLKKSRFFIYLYTLESLPLPLHYIIKMMGNTCLLELNLSSSKKEVINRVIINQEDL